MLCPPFPDPRTSQVWPGNGIDVFSAESAQIKLAVVSTFGNFLNLERWYFASRPSTTEGPLGFCLKPALPTSGDPDAFKFVESYMDRAVLTDIDWTRYSRPASSASPFGILEGRSPEPFIERTLATHLTPVLVENVAMPNSVVLGTEPVNVWIQFWTTDGMLTLIVWYIEDVLRWPGGKVALPSAFEMPAKGCAFQPVQAKCVPSSGWLHAGGQRPAPWPLMAGATLL
jgi:hypothetical protein